MGYAGRYKARLAREMLEAPPPPPGMMGGYYPSPYNNDPNIVLKVRGNPPLTNPFSSNVVRQDSTQKLLDRVYQERLDSERKAKTATPIRPRILNQNRNANGTSTAPAASYGPYFPATAAAAAKLPPTLKEMILDALKECKGSRGVHFPKIVSHIRGKYPLSNSVNYSLESEVNKVLNSMILKGNVSQSYGMKSKEGTYRLLNTNFQPSELNLTVTGQGIQEVKVLRTGNALPGPNSHLCRTVNKGMPCVGPVNLHLGYPTSPKRRTENQAAARLAQPHLRGNNPMLTKSFGARAGLAITKDVRQRPNTPYSPSKPPHHINFGNILKNKDNKPGRHYSGIGSTQGVLGTPHDLGSPRSFPSDPDSWKTALGTAVSSKKTNELFSHKNMARLWVEKPLLSSTRLNDKRTLVVQAPVSTEVVPDVQSQRIPASEFKNTKRTKGTDVSGRFKGSRIEEILLPAMGVYSVSSELLADVYANNCFETTASDNELSPRSNLTDNQEDEDILPVTPTEFRSEHYQSALNEAKANDALFENIDKFCDLTLEEENEIFKKQLNKKKLVNEIIEDMKKSAAKPGSSKQMRRATAAPKKPKSIVKKFGRK